MPIPLNQIKSEVEKILREEVSSESTNLYDLGLIDSFGAVALITDLEKVFKTKVNILEFADEKSFSLSKITDIFSAALDKGIVKK